MMHTHHLLSLAVDPPILFPSVSSTDLTDDGPSVPDESPEYIKGTILYSTTMTSHMRAVHAIATTG